LLLIKSAVFDAALREAGVCADELADLGHGAAEVATLQTRGDGNVLTHVFAMQFQLARGLDYVRDLIELHDRAVGCAQRQFAAWNFSRRSAITVAVERFRLGLSLIRKSPVFSSTRWMPSAAPVRRE